MDLETLKSAPERSLGYLERYVNDGSPSGFSRVGQLSPETDPLGFSPWFHPCFLTPEAGRIELYAETPEIPGCPKNVFLIHPDLSEHSELVSHKVTKLKSLKLTPTSSGRTSRVVQPQCNYYLKFHYPFVIGRILRSLPRIKTIAGPEMSSHLQKAILTGSLGDRLHILPEIGAAILHLENSPTSATWGLIYRSASPVGKYSKAIHSVAPLFSLWSTDRLRSFDPLLIDQLFLIHKRTLPDLFLERILYPIIDAFFLLITHYGLQIELNAQNILIGFDEGFSPIAVILRDLNGIEKDITIHKALELNIKYESSPYKEISRESDPDTYIIRHSFAFDSKLTHYVLLPIAFAVANALQERFDFLIGPIRNHISKWLPKLPKNYFPDDNVWYTHEDVDLSHSRPYITKIDPPLR